MYRLVVALKRAILGISWNPRWVSAVGEAKSCRCFGFRWTAIFVTGIYMRLWQYRAAKAVGDSSVQILYATGGNTWLLRSSLHRWFRFSSLVLRFLFLFKEMLQVWRWKEDWLNCRNAPVYIPTWGSSWVLIDRCFLVWREIVASSPCIFSQCAFPSSNTWNYIA